MTDKCLTDRVAILERFASQIEHGLDHQGVPRDWTLGNFDERLKSLEAAANRPAHPERSYPKLEGRVNRLLAMFNEHVAGLDYSHLGLMADIAGLRGAVERLEQNHVVWEVKTSGNDANGGAFGSELAIPPLPAHPRFRKHNGVAEFDCGSVVGREHWIRIHEMQGKRLEECCAIARCWFWDQKDKVEQLEEEWYRCHKAWLAWAEYARRGK